VAEVVQPESLDPCHGQELLEVVRDERRAKRSVSRREDEWSAADSVGEQEVWRCPRQAETLCRPLRGER
jgi:hypothetical protein